MTIVFARSVNRPLKRLAAGAISTLLAATLVVAGPAQQAQAQGTDAQGLQFGQVVNLDTCQLTTPINLFLGDPWLLARTAWIRIDPRAAGDASQAGCDPTAAYHGLLGTIASQAPHIKVIGLLSNDFVYGEGLDIDPQLFASRAGQVACDTGYSQIDVWEVWNEPSLDGTLVPAADYAELLGLAARAVRDCGDQVISGGVTPNQPIEYLNAVSAAIGANGYGGYQNLPGAVDGIGIHPYVEHVTMGTPGQQHLNAFVWALDDAFGEPLYLTEFGWPVNPSIDEATQCHNLVNAFQMLHQNWRPEVVAATWFTMQDFNDPDRNFGLYDGNAEKRIAYYGYRDGACPPAAVTDVTATALDSNRILVTWTDNSSIETSFNLYNGVTHRTIPANTTSYIWTGLTPGTWMCFALQAVNAAGPSAWSDYGCTFTP
ncbi:fibronectin type III domain protein [Micromonospora sp. Llam0]|uniref:fibronectin type III domain-containing protein n=1 Tax=Micromonospora sp. Llam0 TaxID=2485143 RepID=UPI000F49C762|nr:fibronectin type III domain-containing protein [Micromonospora sp. Llam0]ROO62362.1 fibronectin type III domain protein [Micromonospora sp. Llam0]